MGETIDVSYWVQKSENGQWVNVSKPDKRRGWIHALARQTKKRLTKNGQTAERVRVCRYEVTVDLEL